MSEYEGKFKFKVDEVVRLKDESKYIGIVKEVIPKKAYKTDKDIYKISFNFNQISYFILFLFEEEIEKVDEEIDEKNTSYNVYRCGKCKLTQIRSVLPPLSFDVCMLDSTPHDWNQLQLIKI